MIVSNEYLDFVSLTRTRLSACQAFLPVGQRLSLGLGPALLSVPAVNIWSALILQL